MNRSFSSILGLAFLMIVSPLAFAGKSVHDPGPANQVISVYVYNYAKVGENKLKEAQSVARQIYQNAGIEIEWLSGPVTAEQMAKFSTSKTWLGARDLVLRLQPAVPAQWAKYEQVCGVAIFSDARQHAVFADIYPERVEKLTWKKLSGAPEGIFNSSITRYVCAGLTLGIVMAHELGHLMLGTNSHSSHGIMRAELDRQDLQDAYIGKRTFMPEQVQQLHVNLLARTQAAMQRRMTEYITP